MLCSPIVRLSNWSEKEAPNLGGLGYIDRSVKCICGLYSLLSHVIQKIFCFQRAIYAVVALYTREIIGLKDLAINLCCIILSGNISEFVSSFYFQNSTPPKGSAEY